MNENFHNSKILRSVNVSNDVGKKPGNFSNFSQNQITNHQALNSNLLRNHISQNILPQLINLIPPQITVSQSSNQTTLINMGFGASPFLKNHQLYSSSIPNTFAGLNTISSPSYGTDNVSYAHNMHTNHCHSSQSILNYKDTKLNHTGSEFIGRKLKFDTTSARSATSTHQCPVKSSNYPVRLLINSGLVGPLIGRKGEKIKEITSSTGAKIDIKRESVPYSQFGLNTYMFSGLNRRMQPNGGIHDDSAAIGTSNITIGNGNVGNGSVRAESQIVFIVSDPDKCSAAITEIMQLCSQEARDQGREEPNMGLLAEDRFCARLIGKDGRFLNWVRGKSGSQIHVSNVPTITTLSEQPHIISLDRIISCRGGGLGSLLEAERLISDKIRQCVLEDEVQKPSGPRLFAAKDDSNSLLPVTRVGDVFGRLYPCSDPGHSSGAVPSVPGGGCGSIPPSQRPLPAGTTGYYSGTLGHHRHDDVVFPSRPRPHSSSIIGSGIVHNANPNWPDNLKLDENLYVRIPQVCAGSIIGSEGKTVRRIMAETGTYIQISKSNLGSIDSVPAVHTYRKQSVPEQQRAWSKDDRFNERLITIKGSAQSQCQALTHIFSRVRICYNSTMNEESLLLPQQQNPGNHSQLPPNSQHYHQQPQQVRLWVLLRVPKLILGRLIGKEGKVIRQLQLSSRTFLSFPRLKRLNNEEACCCKVVKSSNDDIDANDSTVNENETENNKNSKSHECPGECGDEKKRNSSSSSSSVAVGQETLHNPDWALFGDPDLHPVEIYGTNDAVETAIFMIKRLVYSSIFSLFGPALIPGPAPPLNGPVTGMPTPLHQQLAAPPPPPSHAFLMSPMLVAAHQRRISDCSGPGHGVGAGAGSASGGGCTAGPFFNSVSHMHPAAFMHQALLASHLTKNHKKTVHSPYSQKTRSDQRSNLETKSKPSDIETVPISNQRAMMNDDNVPSHLNDRSEDCKNEELDVDKSSAINKGDRDSICCGSDCVDRDETDEVGGIDNIEITNGKTSGLLSPDHVTGQRFEGPPPSIIGFPQLNVIQMSKKSISSPHPGSSSFLVACCSPNGDYPTPTSTYLQLSSFPEDLSLSSSSPHSSVVAAPKSFPAILPLSSFSDSTNLSHQFTQPPSSALSSSQQMSPGVIGALCSDGSIPSVSLTISPPQLPQPQNSFPQWSCPSATTSTETDQNSPV